MRAEATEGATQRLDPRQHSIARFRVHVVHGPDLGYACTSDGEEMTIGTDKSCDLRLSDPAVSRHHCAVVVHAEGIQIRDLDSTNERGDHRCRPEPARARGDR